MDRDQTDQLFTQGEKIDDKIVITSLTTSPNKGRHALSKEHIKYTVYKVENMKVPFTLTVLFVMHK